MLYDKDHVLLKKGCSLLQWDVNRAGALHWAADRQEDLLWALKMFGWEHKSPLVRTGRE